MKILLVVLFAVGQTLSLPYPNGGRAVYLNGGHYRRSQDQGYIPEEVVSTLVFGDALATNSRIGYIPFGDEAGYEFNKPSQGSGNKNREDRIEAAPSNRDYERETAAGETYEVTTQISSSKEEIEPAEPDEVTQVGGVGGPRESRVDIPKRKQKPSLPDEDKDLDSSWPFKSGGNTFFPIFLGFPKGNRRSTEGEGYYPGGATAIANSFNTGKGGIASSHATSFADPASSYLFRNLNRKDKGSTPQQTQP